MAPIKTKNKITKIIVALFASALLISCDKHPEFEIWAGNWETADGVIESWEMNTYGNLEGNAYAVENGDTVVVEYLVIEKVEGEWTYTAAIPAQNEGKGIPFRLVEWSQQHYIFSNPEHDFPQYLRYDFQTNDSLVVYAEGVNPNGSRRETSFIFNRTN